MSRNNRTALSAFCCCVMTASFWRWSSPNLLCFSSSVDLRAMMRFLARSCSALTRSGDCTMRCDNFSPSAWAARMLTFSWSWNWKTCSRTTFCFPPPPPLHLPRLEFPPKGTLDGVPQQNQLRQLHYSSSPGKAPLTVVFLPGKSMWQLHSPGKDTFTIAFPQQSQYELRSPGKTTLTINFPKESHTNSYISPGSWNSSYTSFGKFTSVVIFSLGQAVWQLQYPFSLGKVSCDNHISWYCGTWYFLMEWIELYAKFSFLLPWRMDW